MMVLGVPKGKNESNSSRNGGNKYRWDWREEEQVTKGNSGKNESSGDGAQGQKRKQDKRKKGKMMKLMQTNDSVVRQKEVELGKIKTDGSRIDVCCGNRRT